MLRWVIFSPPGYFGVHWRLSATISSVVTAFGSVKKELPVATLIKEVGLMRQQILVAIIAGAKFWLSVKTCGLQDGFVATPDNYRLSLFVSYLTIMLHYLPF